MADVEKYKEHAAFFWLALTLASLGLLINYLEGCEHVKHLRPPELKPVPIVIGDGSLECLEKTATNDLKENRTIFSRFVPPPKQTIIVYKRGTQTITTTVNYPAPADDAIDLMQKGDLKCRPHK